MATDRASVKVIEDAINSFTHGLPTMQKRQFDIIFSMLKDLSVDVEGKIKPTIGNLRIINRVKNQLSSLVNSDEYTYKIAKLKESLEKVTDVQTAYLASAFENFEPPKILPHIEKMAYENMVSDLTDAGMNENVINKAAQILEDHFKDESSFSSLVDKLESQMVGDEEIDSSLISYSKQIINDTMSNYARQYHSIVTQDLGLQWFGYVGALVEGSRALCRKLVHKHWVHESELGGIARGVIDGEDGMDVKGKFHSFKEGLMPGTNASNFQARCGGYNCGHQLVPVDDSSVPSSIRRKFESDVPADQEEIADSRPTRKK